MESFQTFEEIFKRCAAERNGKDLAEILKCGRQYFQNISTDDTESILQSLFDQNNGLLYILNDELNKPYSRKDFDSAIKEGFHLLKFVMEEFPTEYCRYILDTKNTCRAALITQGTWIVQTSACSAFKRLIELFHDQEMELGETVVLFVSKFHILSDKERSLVFSVLSTIAKYRQDIPEMQQYSECILKWLKHDLMRKYIPGAATQPSEIETYLEVFTDMLDKFAPPSTQTDFYKDLYGCVKDLSAPEKYWHRKTKMRAAVNLLSRHMNLFRDFVYQDYMDCYNLFVKIGRQKGENGACGQLALKNFYRTIASVLQNRDSEDDRQIFEYFRSRLQEQDMNVAPESNELRLTVYGFSQLAAPCKRYMSDKDVKEMYLLIARRAVPLCSRSESKQIYLNVCDYQDALSEIVSHMSDLSIDHVNVLVQLGTFLIKKFPDVSETGRRCPVSSLKKTIDRLGMQNKGLLEEYLQNVVYDGVVWSCSHTLLVDAELQRGVKGRPICYKNYLPLWVDLVKSKEKLVFEMLMHVCTVLIRKLDLRTETKENNILCNVALSQTATNQADFRIFVNLVDLYVDIICELDDASVESYHFTMHSFLRQVIRMSYRHPLISGFYKLAHVTLKKFRNLVDDKDTETFEIVYKYLSSTVDRIGAFSNELLSACLYLILEMPVRYARNLLNRTIPVFKIAFSMGLADFQLARTTLKALEEWTYQLDSSEIKNFLQEVIPSLEPYLQSKESLTEILQDIVKSRRKVIKNVTKIDSENTLKNFQRTILLFLGSLDSEVILNFLHKGALNTRATWDKKDLLKYALPFPELQIDVCFDKILPRLVALAESSSDRRTKLNACEVFHALVAFVLGKTSQQLLMNPERFAALYKVLCPALLNLGCDADEITRQLFQPFTLQLTHWMSSQFMYKLSIADILLDSIYQGLCSENKSELRDFSGNCLAEYTEWSNKQLDNRTFYENVEQVISKLINFALHPSARKRVAAAVAFNHLYKILREEDDIVSRYWLELLYCFVKSFDGCDDPSIRSAIDHVERVIKERTDVFEVSHQHRRKPAEFQGDTLDYAVDWLFAKCGTLDESCRVKCMGLYENICGYMNRCDSEKGAVELYIDTYGIDAFNEIVLAGFKKKIDIDVETMLAFLKSFDCYIWLIKKKLINPTYHLFSDVNPKRDTIFFNAKDLVHLLVTVKMETDEDVTTVSTEFEKLHTLQCKTILTLFDFIHTLLNLDGNVIPELFLNTELYQLMSKCIMSPQTIGFDGRNLEMAEALPTRMEELLTLMKTKFGETLPSSLRAELIKNIQMRDGDIFHFDEIACNDEVTSELSQYIKGLIMLDRQQLLTQLCGEENAFHRVETNIEQIFKYLRKEHIGELVCTALKPTLTSYFQNFMELLLMHYKEPVMEKLVYLMTDDTLLLNTDSRHIKHGEYFLSIFKDTVHRYILKGGEKSLTALLESTRTASILFSVVEDLLLFVRRCKRELTLEQDRAQILVNAIFEKFSNFERTVLNDENRKQKLINIYGIAVSLTSKPTDIVSKHGQFYSWILKELTGVSDIEHKTRILQNFLVCLTDVTTDDNSQVVAILRTLRSSRHAMCLNDSSQQNMNTLKVINCFETLLTLLPITKSVAVFEASIFFAADGGEHLYTDKVKNSLQRYFSSIPSSHVLSSLGVAYQLFMDSSVSQNFRFDVLRKFLLPAFEYCVPADTERFFETKIRDIYLIICQSLAGNDSDIEQLIISKIGCYELIGIMFVKVPLASIEDADGTITRNAIEDVKPETRLMKELYLQAIRVRALKTTNPEHREIMRLLHCSAYNCSITIVSQKKEEESYQGVFTENSKKEQLIWERIVDCSKRYNIQQTFSEYPKYRSRLVNIRKSLREIGARQQNYSYIHSYDLSTSTLSEDINAYDYNRATFVQPTRTDYSGECKTLLFECDNFNDHECMNSICGVLTHMVEENIVTTPSENDANLPMWVKRFRASMLEARQDNVRLFLLKIIQNVQCLFKKYAKLFLAPIASVVISYLRNNTLNYIIADVLLVLIDWHTEAVPEAEPEKTLAQNLLETIVGKVVIDRSNDIGKDIYKYNFNLIRMLVEVWQTCLDIPKNLDEKMKSAPASSVHLILICLVNNMQDRVVQRDEILTFLRRSLENWCGNEETVLQSCEALGLILKSLADDNPMRSELIESIRNVLCQMQSKFESLQAKCIRAISKNFLVAACEYSDFTRSNVSRIDLPSKAACLEVFLLRVPTLDAEQIVKELGYMKFQVILKNKTACCELIALRIIRAVVSKLAPFDFLALATLALPYVKNESSEYRELSFDIFISVFKKYANDISDDESVKTLMKMSTQLLLRGVLDPASNLQEKLLNFWNQEAGLTETSKGRLLDILRMHTTDVENVFLPFVVLAMLNLCSKTAQYSKKMFDPLHNCEYRDQKIELRWTAKNLSSITPLFVPSLASQIVVTSTQVGSSFSMGSFENSYSTSMRQSNDRGMLRATQEPRFEPTLDENVAAEDSFDQPVYDGEFKVPKIPQPAHNKRSKRFLTNPSKVSDHIRETQIKKNIRHKEMIKEETARRRDSAKLYRLYRIGDFPDIEITHSSVIEPLQELVKKDQLICKDIMVAIICSLIKEVTDNERSKDFFENVIETLKSILQNCQGKNSIVAAILEILFEAEKLGDRCVMECPPDVIVNVTKVNGLHSLGTLVLEQRLIYEPVDLQLPVKKLRTDDTVSGQTKEWIHLASLYQSMNEVDIVLSILCDHVHSEVLKKSSLAMAACDWSAAKEAYANAYESETDSIKEHCLQGLFECLSHLSSWSKIGNRINNKLNENIDNIWNDPWKEWMFPWMFKACVQEFLEKNYFVTNFSEALKSWLGDKEKLRYIKRVLGEELAMLLIHSTGQDVFARDILMSTLDNIQEEWITLHPLSTQLRISELQKLCGIHDINMYLKALKSSKSAEPLAGIRDIQKFWTNSVPSVQDDLLVWDKLVTYRVSFESLLRENIDGETSNDDESQNVERDELLTKMQTTCLELRLKVIDMALYQKNKAIARKHVRRVQEKLIGAHSYHEHKLVLNEARLKRLSGDLERNTQEKLSRYTSVWTQLHNLLGENLDSALSIDVRRDITLIASSLLNESQDNTQFAELLRVESAIREHISAGSDDLHDIKNALELYGLDNLKQCCDSTSSDAGECYFIVAKYCYDRLAKQGTNVALFREFVSSTLKAMSHGSLKAAHYFPCLLKPEYLSNDETKKIFAEISGTIQTWLFLSWQAQLFSHLATPISTLVIPIIERIVESYPNAVLYTFRLTVETYPKLKNDVATYQIRRILYENPDVDRFLKAMQYVVQPETYLRYYLSELIDNLSQGVATAANILIKQVFPSAREDKDAPRQGSTYRKINQYRDLIRSLQNKTLDDVKKDCRKWSEQLRNSLDRRKLSARLNDYSPWLYELAGSDLEVPGQYTGNRMPLPQYHTRIMRIEFDVKVMQSLRKPIRITMIGDDAKDYSFLVKFGEDLRLDQRLEQLFEIMNRTLRTDVTCSQRRLSIDTYQVIPLSKALGLIQWVDDTRSLKDLICFSFSQNENAIYNSVHDEYSDWIKKAASRADSKIEAYRQALTKYDAASVTDALKKFEANFDWDCLRKNFLTLSPSLESFVSLRRNFVTTYATMCVAHWILGIGDRNLENTLITVGSGRSLGIDFGHAFGTGIDQPIPELMPFRLTPQILGLLRPFTERDLLRTTMVHVLRALRNDDGPIFACLDVFVNEPLNWTEQVRKKSNDDEDHVVEVKWQPQKKISIVRKKLDGIKPSTITVEQLKEQHGGEYFDRYVEIINGTENGRLRTKMKENHLTPEEQIECLLDQAMDYNILGRVFSGWRPWL